MNGFREQLVESLSGVNGDITIYNANKDKIKKIQEKNPSISFVENIQSRVITSNENGIAVSYTHLTLPTKRSV